MEAAPAHQAAGELEEHLVDVGEVLPADPQAFELMQPGQRAFHHPTLAAQPRAVGGGAPGDLRPDTPRPQHPTVAVEVVAAVGALGLGGIYVDANAVAPTTARALGGVVERAGGRFVDGDLIGGPVRPGGATRLYLSGPAGGHRA